MAHSKPTRDIIREKENFAVSGKRQIKFCQPCSRKDKQTDAKYFCTDCAEYQCSECSVAHKVFSFALNHNVVSEKEARTFTVAYDMKGLDQCKLHKKLLEFICEDHDQLCCSTCAIVGHRKCHSVMEVEQKGSSIMQDITTLKHDLSTTGKKAEATEQKIERNRTKFATNALDVKNKIHNLREKVETMFEQWDSSADKKIVAFQQQLFQEYDTSISSCKSCKDIVAQIVSDLQSVSDKGTLSQQFIFAHHFTDQLVKLKEITDNNNKTLRDAVVSIVFYDFLTLPPSEDTEPWKVTTKFGYSNESVNNQCVDKTTNMKLSLLTSVLLREDVDNVRSFSGVDFLPDGRLVAVQYVSDKCVVFNRQLQTVGSKIFKFGPRGVAAVSDTEIVITSGFSSKLYFAHVSKSSEVTVTRSFDKLKTYNSICVMNPTEFLVSIIEDIPAVGIVSISGKEKELSLKIPLRRYQRKESACCYMRNCNKVFFTDTNADIVFICDISNNTSIEVKDDSIKEPRGVAIGHNDSIFVCCKTTNSIVHLSSAGKILGSHKLNIPYPHIVCVSKDTSKMVVTNESTTMIQLFDIYNQV